MKEKPDHHDADLLLRLYELRRDEKLREARDWTIALMVADSLEDFRKRYPGGTKENAWFRMATSYWEMAGSLVNQGLINNELFFETTGEFWTVWERVKPLVEALRLQNKNPLYLKNLETIAEKYEQWMTGRAPEALGESRKRLDQIVAQARAAKKSEA